MAKDNARTWREQRITLQPAEGGTLYFSDTKPNHILISNPSPTALYIGVNGNVSPTVYDTVIPPYGTKLYARMTGSTRVYLYSDAPESITVQVTSWEDDFNPASVSQSFEMVGVGANGILGIVDINNVIGSLPAGSNVIGGVTIQSFGVSLPSGNNKIGDVGLKEGNALIGKVMVESLPQEMATSKKVSKLDAGEVVIKSTKGVVYQVVSSDPNNIQLYDGTREAWLKGNFASTIPLACDTDIRIKFLAGGDAYVLFK